MKHDPYFMKARFASICPETGKQISKGDTIAYYPRDRKAFCEDSKSADNVRALEFAKAYNMGDANY